MKRLTKRLLSVILSTTLLFSLGGCSDSRVKEKDNPFQGIDSDIITFEAALTPKKLTPFSSEFVAGLNRYGFDVLLKMYDGENIAISPASLQLALLMTAIGAEGNTRDEMMSALRMSGISEDEILSSVAQLMWRANRNGMETSNSLWLQDDYNFAKEYVSHCNENFMADLYNVDFVDDPSGAEELMNAWVNHKTHGKIPEILKNDVSSLTRLVLINALYFLGEWETSFDKDQTFDEVFHGSNGDTTVPFMHARWTVRYTEGNTFQLILLPFRGDEGETGPYAMTFILPKKGYAPEDVSEEISETGIESLLSSASEKEVIISLPKFEFEFQSSMIQTMQALGMNEAFTMNAQFANMLESNKNDLYVSEIMHKTYIRVNEEGAEAAAATAVVMDIKAAPNDDPEQTIVFYADRPFLFAICDTTDGTILFTGITANL